MDMYQAEQFLVKMFFKPMIPVELRSKPGVGKTQLISQVGKILEEKLNEPVGVYTHMLSTYEAADCQGIMMPHTDEEGDLVSKFTRAPILPPKDAPRYTITLFDERAQGGQDVQKTIARFFNEHKIGGQSFREGTHNAIWSCSNRVSDNSGVFKDMEFMLNRLMVIEIDPRLDPWVRWAEANDVHPWVIAFAKTRPGIIFSDKIEKNKDSDIGAFCTPRTLVMAGDVLHAVPDLDMATEGLMGLIGEGATTELIAFLRVAMDLPSFEEIIANPKGIKVPDRPDAQWALTQMCAHRMAPENAGKVFQFMDKHMGEEFQVACIRGACRRDPQIPARPEFSEWTRKHSKLIMNAARAR